MYKEVRIDIRHSRRTLLALVLSSSIFLGGGAYGSSSFRLARGGYSPTKGALLVGVMDDANYTLKWLTMYDEATGSIKRISIPVNGEPTDFAWVPGRAAFVVTHNKGMTLFREDVSGNGYTPKAIPCPVDVFPTWCSWSPNGEWLAVNCIDREDILHGRLGLYRFKDEKFFRTGLGIDYHQVFWGGDARIYATNEDDVLTVEQTEGKPSVIRKSPLKEGFIAFYGMLGGQPLFQTSCEVKLGEKTIISLDQPFKSRVIATEMVAFVSASESHCAVFDRSGREISRIGPDRIIRFGSAKDPNTVFGLADNGLVRVSIENGSLNVHKVCDLEKGKDEGKQGTVSAPRRRGGPADERSVRGVFGSPR